MYAYNFPIDTWVNFKLFGATSIMGISKNLKS